MNHTIASIDNVLFEMFPSFLATCGEFIFWIPFSPRIDRMQSYISIYYGMLAFEAISHVLSFICIVALTALFIRHRIVHLNLTVMLIFIGVLYSSGAALRLLQILYEIGWINSLSPACPPVPQIVIIRVSSYISVVLLLGAIVVERAFATYYVIDYEKRRRPWIGILITVGLFVICLFISSQIVQGGINGVFFSAAMCAPVCVSVFVFRMLLSRNEKRLAKLTDMIGKHSKAFLLTSLQDEYSLSLRLQLRENIWTMKKCNRMALVAVPIALSCLPFLALPPLLLRNPLDLWLLELITESNNAVFAAMTPFFVALIIIIFEPVRAMLLPKRMRRKSIRLGNKSDSLTSEADQYFDQLKDLFDKGLNLKQR